MNEVTKCSISGVSFTLDIDAFETLKAYLDTLRDTYKESVDGAEIVADIEARIVELILSVQDNQRVVEKPLVLNIIAQMGSPEDISDRPLDDAPRSGEPRIPRRLYRDTDNAALGGVCAGIAKYFDIDTTWVRLGIFFPLLLSCFSWVPCMGWAAPVGGNLFGILMLCYLVMWFAVPAPRTARQKLEMHGEKITAQSISETTAACNNDVDNKAKPIVAEAVSIFGRIVLVGLKIFVGFMVFILIACACTLIVGLFAVSIVGSEGIPFDGTGVSSLWIPILGIFIALIPIGLLIYIF
ncbi:MAG: PspC domain-containing protein, partial [Alistipes sp.]